MIAEGEVITKLILTKVHRFACLNLKVNPRGKFKITDLAEC
ncbi:MAG: hypothetical protein ACTS4V_00015 [Candidatus Hodgkinia cicadicola]